MMNTFLYTCIVCLLLTGSNCGPNINQDGDNRAINDAVHYPNMDGPGIYSADAGITGHGLDNDIEKIRKENTMSRKLKELRKGFSLRYGHGW